MEITINKEHLEKNQLKTNQYILLHAFYFNNFSFVKELFSKEKAIEIRNSLIGTKYILSEKTELLSSTIISKKECGKLLGLIGSDINFWEFYQVYPIKVGSRVLRASTEGADAAKKHREKYLRKIKTEEHHRRAIEVTENFISIKKRNNELQFLPAIEKVLNNALWEEWEALMPSGNEEKTLAWNDSSI